MEKLSKTKYLELNLNATGRYLFISDVHGNLKLLKKALKEVNFSKDDYLFIIGDLVEKGKENLPILDYLMELKKNYQVYLLRGNCDQVFNFLIPPIDKAKLLYFANVKGNSVINEMALRLGIKLDENVDAAKLAKSFYTNFKKYYDFIDELYDVILLDNKYLLVHGGLDDLAKMPLYNDSLLKNDFYYFKAKPSKYIRIVGHNPTCNLCKKEVRNRPIIDLVKNVIDIDGGNNVSLSGELNVLKIVKDDISYSTFNLYPKYMATAKITHPQLEAFHTSSYLDDLSFKGERIGDYYLFYKDSIKLYTHYLDARIEKGFSFDATNCFIDLDYGDTYYLAKYALPYSIIIKDGIVGLIESDVIKNDLQGE